jgi:hypothetical protein
MVYKGIIVLIILLIVLSSWVIFFRSEFNDVKEFITKVESSDKMYKISDDCGIVTGGKLLHAIKNEDICRTKCRNLCDTINSDYERVVFEECLAQMK